MSQSIRRFASRIEFFIGVLALLFSLWLLSYPLHPTPGDNHGGLLAAFAGLALLPIAVFFVLASVLLGRNDRWHWLAQVPAAIGLLTVLIGSLLH